MTSEDATVEVATEPVSEGRPVTRLRDLSGGMKQKILAAMALAADAQILVADEPTANLDTQARHAFFALVAARPADAVLILCSHRAGEVRQLVDRVVELREGHLIGDASLRDVVRDRALCRIEVVPSSQDAALPLTALGFGAVTDDLWQRTCTPAEKLELISQILAHRCGRCTKAVWWPCSSLPRMGCGPSRTCGAGFELRALSVMTSAVSTEP